MEGVREAKINVTGDWRMPGLGELNERIILIEEVKEAVNEMKSGKAPGPDGFPVECLKKGCMTVLEWRVRLLKVIVLIWGTPMNCRGASSAPVQREG